MFILSILASDQRMGSKTGFPWFSSFSSVMGKLGQSVADFASLMMEAKESPSYACKRCHSAVSYVGMGQHQDQLYTYFASTIDSGKLYACTLSIGWDFKIIPIVNSCFYPVRPSTGIKTSWGDHSWSPKFDQGTSATIWSRPVCWIRACHGNCKE